MKSRRVLTILLSMAIMLTFMPTMAFAAVEPIEPNNNDGWALHDFDTDHEPVEVKEFDEFNVVGYACVDDDDCQAVFYRIEPKAGAHRHTPAAERLNLTVGEYVERLFADYPELAEKFTAEELYEMINDMAVGKLGDAAVCNVSVLVCNECQKVYLPIAGNFRALAHKGEAPDCVMTFTCERCGETVANPDYNPNAHDDEGKWEFVKRIGEEICAKDPTYEPTEEEEDILNGYTVDLYKCKDCGETKKVPTLNEGGEESVKHDGIGSPVGKEGEESKLPRSKDTYILFDGKYYEPNTIIVDSTCTHAGRAKLVCTECGTVFEGEAVVPKKAHNIETIEVPASCFTRGYTLQKCKDCGTDYKKWYTEDKLNHDYKVETVIEPSCYQDGVVAVSCTRCGLAVSSDDVVYIEALGIPGYEENKYFEDFIETNAKGEKFFVGFDNELKGDKRIKLDSTDKLEHKWGGFELMSEATCTEPAKYAKVCKVCGHFDAHHEDKRGEALGHELQTYTVAPTCGDRGFTYDTCTRCKQSVRNDEAADAAWVPTKILKGAEGVWAYDFKECVVAEGTPCQFEWVSENGEKVHKCKVCGAIDNSVPEEKVTPTPAPEPTPTPAPTPSPVVVKAENGLVAAANKVKAKSSKKKTIANYKAFVVSGATGAVTFAKTSGNSKIKVAADGKVTVKKGLKKGKTYKVYVNVTAAGDANTNAKTVPVLLKVKVK